MIRSSILLPQEVFDIQLLQGHIDLAPELRHNQSVQVTQFPIGKDTFVTDHAIVRPFMLGGQFIVSNSVDKAGNPVTLDRLENAWNAILMLFRSRQTVQVATAHMTYSEMLFTEVNRVESNETGTALVIDFQMQQIQRIQDVSGTRTEEDDEPTGDGEPNSGTLDRGSQPLENVVYDDEGDIHSGIIPLANVWVQRQETVLGTTPFGIEVTYHENGTFWSIVLSDSTGKVNISEKLFAGPQIDIRFGNLEVLTSANVDAYPPLPSETGPWGSDYRLQWQAS